jgi:feruloyl esterase
LHEAQRYGTEFDGMIVGAPVIDEIATNSQWHDWFWRVNVDANGKNILTQNKIPALAAAVRQACGVKLNDGTFDTPSDPRACSFDARSLASASCDPTTTDACLTPAQAVVANQWWSGPIDGYGGRLTPGGVPFGSEMYWGVPANANTPQTSLGDYIFSNDFPMWMSAFDAPTGITGTNMKFDRQTFDQMHVLTGMYDPTNPDLRGFKNRGAKMLFWTGATDSGASPYMVLNYFEALKQFMGQQARDEFAKLFVMAGVGHCGGNKDLYTPLMNWVEQSVAPDLVSVAVAPTTVAGTTFQPRTRPVWTHPNVSIYDPATDSYKKGTSPIASDRFEWIGLRHYTPNHTRWCSQKASGPEQWALRCDPNP